MTDIEIPTIEPAASPDLSTPWVPLWPLSVNNPAPSYGTTLPASPVDGQEAILVDSATNPTYQWRFRYNAGSSSAYKWEFVGGVPLYAEVATAEGGATYTAYVALATPGPSITLPRAGDYMISHGARIRDTVAANNPIFMSYDIGATGAVDADAVVAAIASGSTSMYYSVSRSRRKNALTAVTLTAKYKGASPGNGGEYGSRWIQAVPVRVS